tara:strand:+ start:480 stop:1451 length:972 start_codon:yes stop_codon:yes gene_type:complete
MAKQGRKPIPKSQSENFNENLTPYSADSSNPNTFTSTGRGYKFSFKGDTVKPFSLGIQDIDESIVFYFKNVIKPTVTQNGGRIAVPVMYGSPERWKSVQADGFIRDKSGKLMAPLIMFKRTSMANRKGITNKLDANNPQNFGVFRKKYSKNNQYDNFSLLTNRIPEVTYYAVVAPDYVTLTYKCVIYTYYVEQLNKIIESLNYASGAYWGDPARFKFQTYIESFSTLTDLTLGSERVVRGEFEFKLQGYIIPDTIQKDMLAIKKFSDKSKLIFDVETIEDANIIDGIYDNTDLANFDRLAQSEEGGLINSYTTLKKHGQRNIT